MAQKRMFSLSVVDTDKFLEMPISSRLLYYELGMRADDDGFVDNWKKILLFTGLKEDDLKILISKQFILPFESGVIVIRHWRLNNYLQNDRIKPTIYQQELKQLGLDENNVYQIGENNLIENKKPKSLDKARIKRIEAKKESDLPYSFEYKIRNAFYGEKCPICGVVMDNTYDKNIPTIQHNIPISKGGKHEIDNISVVCRGCNCSIKNDETTPPYNNEKVKEIWNVYKNEEECIHSIDKNNIDKNRLVYNSKFQKPTLEEVENYCKERNNNIDAQHFIDFYESKGWKVGNQPMKDWKACMRTWESKDKKQRNVPSWFDKEIESTPATEEEIRELEERLKK